MVIRQSNVSCWATIWRSKARDAAIKNQVKTDPHFQECTVRMCHCKMWIRFTAFDIQANDGMYIAPENRVKTGSRLQYNGKPSEIDCPQKKLDTIWGIFMERKVKYDYAFA
jgi:hypothetical protein